MTRIPSSRRRHSDGSALHTIASAITVALFVMTVLLLAEILSALTLVGRVQ